MPRSATPRTLRHLGHDLGRELFQRLEVRPDDLDRIGALHARQRLFDVVLDILGEVEADAGQLLARTPSAVLRSASPWSGPAGHSSNGLSGANSSTLENGEASLPLSGRPCCDTTVMISGCRSRISRILRGRLGAGIERDGRRHRGADPEIAFLQRRQEFAAEPAMPRARSRREEDARRRSPRASTLPSAQRSTGV